MATGLNHDTFSEQPYITVAEYKAAPTAIDFDNLVVGGDAAAQDAELANVILRASSYMDEFFNQNLCANTETETQRTRLTPLGTLAVHPNNDPIIAVTDFRYGTDPNNLQVLNDCSTIWFEEQQFIVPLAQMATTYSSQGALAFGFPSSPRTQTYIQYTYDAGYVNNLIDTAVAGQSSMTVQNAVGITPGMRYRVFDAGNSETITIASNYVYGSLTVPLAAPLKYNHANTVTFGNLPSAVKQACILLTTAFIKVRGDNSLTMNITTKPSSNQRGADQFGSEIALAMTMVDKYRRIR